MAHPAGTGRSTGRGHRPDHPAVPWITTATAISLGAGLMCFAVTEFMHYLLVPDIGRQKERWLAEAIAALVVSGLVGRLMVVLHRQHQAALARMQVISEINHHIRNALMAISASADVVRDEQYLRIVSDGVDRIDWALREVLPREQPLSEEEQSRLMFRTQFSGRQVCSSRKMEKTNGRNEDIVH